MTPTLRTIASSLWQQLRRYGIYALIAVLLASIGMFIYRGRAELAEAWHLLTSLNPLWLLPFIVMQAGIVLFAAAVYQTTLRRLGDAVSIRYLAGVQMKRILVGTVTPVGGPPSIWVMVRSLQTIGVDQGHSLVAATMRTFGTMIAFALFLPPVFLLRWPGTMMLLASGAALLMISALATPFAFLFRKAPLPGLIERYTPRRILSSIHSLREHRIGPRDMVVPVLIGVLWHIAMMGMLYVALIAVGYHASLRVVLLGYVAGNLAYLITPVFRGVGAVEFAMVFALQRAGVPPVEALGSALLYRVGDLWIPFFAALVYQALRIPLLPRLVASLSRMARSTGQMAIVQHTAELPVLSNARYRSQGRLPVLIEVESGADHHQHYELLTPDQRRSHISSWPVITPTYTG